MGFLFIFVVIAIAFSNATLVDHLHQCPINDGECQRLLFQSAMQHLTKGAPELEIPPLDPFEVRNISVSILDMVDITFLKGVVKGIKGCVFENMSTNIDNRHSTIEIRCSILLRGRYEAKVRGSLIRDILGDQDIHADGNAKMRLENIRIKFDLPFHAVRNEGGEILLQCRNPNKSFDYTYEPGDKASFYVDNIYLGNQDISQMVVPMMNNNWKFIIQAFGKPFMDEAMHIVYIYSHRFFDTVPARFYISDDMEPYVD